MFLPVSSYVDRLTQLNNKCFWKLIYFLFLFHFSFQKRQTSIMYSKKLTSTQKHLLTKGWFLKLIENHVPWNIIIIIIIMMLHHQHGYPWPSLATPPYRPLVQAGLQDCISYQQRAAVCRFELVVLSLTVHGKGSTGVHHLWAMEYIILKKDLFYKFDILIHLIWWLKYWFI